jgi:DNA-binding GntR family transcriptional regulator
VSEPQSSTVVSRQVLADHVYQRLLETLMDGGLEAGAPVSIDGMARRLGVSPTPVREALARLEATGMVRRVALRGYRVAPLFTAEELAQLMAARRVIEPTNAELACRSATPDDRRALQRSIDDLASSPRGPSFADYRAYLQADEGFHRLIADQARNPFLLAAYDALGGQVQRFRFFTGMGVTDADAAIAEHTAILAAFEAGDPSTARTAMDFHIASVSRRAEQDLEHQR